MKARAGTTAAAKLSFPIIDCKVLVEVRSFCENAVMSSKYCSSFSVGSLAKWFLESKSMPRKVVSCAGLVTLCGDSGTPSMLHKDINSC